MKPKSLVLLLLFLPQLLQAQKAALPDSDLTTLIDSAGIPGLSVAVINQKGVVWSKGVGVREAGKPERVDENTVFSAASLSKPLFAYLVLKLADEGKINLDKPLYQYVPFRAIEHDERHKRITARMVLSHQTGLPNWRSGQLNFLFDPGTRFGYSGEGFVYLQGVVTTITGKELDELAQQYVFRPLGMSRSSYRWQPAFEANHATPHNRFGQPTALSRYNESNAAFSLMTTATDYGRFIVALLTGQGLKPATAQAIFRPLSTPKRTLDDTLQASPTIRWGVGIGLAQQAGNEGFWHWGDNGDFRCFVYVSRARKEGVVYFTNCRNGLSIVSDVPARTLGLPVRDIADFVYYEPYRSPFVQVSRTLLKQGAVASAKPFLATKPGGSTRRSTAQLSEEDLLRMADELSNTPQIAQAVELLELGSTYYPQSADMMKASAFAHLKQNDRPKAKAALSRYVVMKPDDQAARNILTQLTEPTKGNVTLRLPGFPAARLITLAGSFNNWQPLHTLFLREGNEWRCTLQLPKGTYQYKIVVDGNWQTDPANPNTQDDGKGNTNSVMTVANK
ncbi:serine hydrolase [Hymenobacter tibetensis]|uniref:Serine hydrolase n=1 Tax=Hymenobacter tibetensis TaxID=497967 RepID=A0ABY4CSN5_9BACT|nr:serine hydrolase [Hymenobacter tibetensis]UOG73213.1 serine hydrolase [Hymenobacter tibetensis]